MRHLDLFSGIGGFALAARWAGIETVAFCEIEEFPRKVLQKNFPGVPIHRDIHDLDGSEYEGIDIITGGYPCQPFSLAGKRRGAEDDRHLWPEMRRVIAQAKPTWVVCENVYGHVTMGLDEVLADLESEGYAAQSFVVPACAKDAPHRRDRVWIVANAYCLRLSDTCERATKKSSEEQSWRTTIENGDLNCLVRYIPRGAQDDWWRAQSEMDRSCDGIPDRVDRLKSLGNAIVPQVAYEILRTIRAV